VVRLSQVTPSARALAVAEAIGRDPRLVEVVLGGSRRIVRQDKGGLIVGTHHGWGCPNAGGGQANVDSCTARRPPQDSARHGPAPRRAGLVRGRRARPRARPYQWGGGTFWGAGGGGGRPPGGGASPGPPRWRDLPESRPPPAPSSRGRPWRSPMSGRAPPSR